MALPPQVFAVKFRAHSILKAAGYISAAAITRWSGKTQIILKKAAHSKTTVIALQDLKQQMFSVAFGTTY